jgi:2-polyprenyl-3-methyl-5-hydroxy-6-metoxy-1,4-benzoquinol methylase
MSDFALVEVACSHCGSTDAEPVGAGVDHEYPETSPLEFCMVRCKCGLVYLNPRPAASELDRIYPDRYYAYQIIEQRLKAGRAKPSALRRFMERRAVGRWHAYADLFRASVTDKARILDVGCGDGTFLNQWREVMGGDAETFGVEMNEKAAAIAEAQGHTIDANRIEDCKLPEQSFHFAYSFHVIEHVEDPVGFMTAVRRALKPGGYALIETPNVGTADFRWFHARHWGAYHFPRHFNLYDADTFKTLAEKAGFQVERVDYVPSAVFWVWTAHSMVFQRSRALADRLFPPVDILLRGNPWIWSLMVFFTLLDRLVLLTTGKTACMRVLLRPKPAAA